MLYFRQSERTKEGVVTEEDVQQRIQTRQISKLWTKQRGTLQTNLYRTDFLELELLGELWDRSG